MFKQTSRSLRCPSQIARAAMHALEEHLPRITIVTLSGGLRLQRDLGSWKNLFRTMRDSESDRSTDFFHTNSYVLKPWRFIDHAWYQFVQAIGGPSRAFHCSHYAGRECANSGGRGLSRWPQGQPAPSLSGTSC
mmetsp:Transcript_54589/g.144250  ORF Transcript_54589/g.144250 Transcript_54589/m.144250 type:complete len:134 (-) Transcript_54589:195-596(-)